MKQVIYGPSGYGKTHLILRGLKNFKNLIIISNNSCIESEFKRVGLNNISINTIPFIIEDTEHKISLIKIDTNKSGIQNDNIIGFNLSTFESSIGRIMALDSVIEWIESTGISENPEYTVIFLNTRDETTNPIFITDIEKWSANIIVEYTIDEFSIKHSNELEQFQISEKWIKVPILNKMYKEKNGKKRIIKLIQPILSPFVNRIRKSDLLHLGAKVENSMEIVNGNPFNLVYISNILINKKIYPVVFKRTFFRGHLMLGLDGRKYDMLEEQKRAYKEIQLFMAQGTKDINTGMRDIIRHRLKWSIVLFLTTLLIFAALIGNIVLYAIHSPIYTINTFILITAILFTAGIIAMITYHSLQ